jgi:hypothetical protein
MKPTKIYALTALVLAIISCASCKKEVYQDPWTDDQKAAVSKKPYDAGFAENDMVLYWNDKAAAVLGVGMIQPNRTRFFAMIQIAVHDALNSIKPKYERYALLDQREQFADPDAAVASAAYWAIKGLNLQASFPVDSWYAESLATIPDGESKELGKTLGKKAADAIIANRANDGFTQVITPGSTIPANGTTPGAYQSTLRYAVANGTTILIQFPVRPIPNWGIVMKPYVIESNTQFRPAAPYAVTGADYTTDYNEVKTKGARIGGNRTSEEEAIAYFWTENRPSILWNQLVRAVISTKKLDAWKTARLFALMHVSTAESINTQLNAGYYFYFWRPETAIRNAATDGNNNTEADFNWLPYLSETLNAQITPPVPGYPNGYAAFGGTTAEILKLFFGADETSVDLTTTNALLPNPKPTRHYTSFSQAASENSLSAIYAGWDFRQSALTGEEMGRQIATYVFNHAFKEEE